MDFLSLLDNICCDSRVKNGIPDLNNPEFCFVLQEYLINEGYSLDEVLDKTYMLFEKGRFPERQAYNKDGILVTFPSKEYKDKAINKGTHFAENPKKQDPTVFADQDPESLSTADIKQDEDPDNVTLDDYVEDFDENDVDDRTQKEKEQDFDVVQSMLIDEPLLPSEKIYDLEELKNNYETYGMYGKGLNWYDSDGNIVGEQYYDEKLEKNVVRILSEVSAGYNKLQKQTSNNAPILETPPLLKLNFLGINSYKSLSKFVSSGEMNKYDFTDESKSWFKQAINYLSKTKDEDDINSFMYWFDNAGGTSETLNKIGKGTATDFIHGSILNYYRLINQKTNIDDDSKENTADIVLIFGGNKNDLLNNLQNISSEQDLKINKSGIISFKQNPNLGFAQVSLKAGIARLGKITKKFFSYLNKGADDSLNESLNVSDLISNFKSKISGIGKLLSKKSGDIYNWFLNKVNKIYESVTSIFRSIPMSDIISQDKTLESLEDDILSSSEEDVVSEKLKPVLITNCNYEAMENFYNFYKKLGFKDLVKKYDSYKSLSKAGGFVINVSQINKEHYSNIESGIEKVYDIFKNAIKNLKEVRKNCISTGESVTREQLSPVLKLRANHIALRKINELINSIKNNSNVPNIQTKDLPQIASELSGEAIFGKNLSLPLFKFTGYKVIYYGTKQQYIRGKQKQFSDNISNEGVEPGYIHIYQTRGDDSLHFQVFMYLLFDIVVDKKEIVPMYSRIAFTVGSGSRFAFNIEMNEVFPLDKVKKQMEK